MNLIRSTLDTLHLIPEWHSDGLCRQVDAELFFPLPGQNDKARQAKEVCAVCPVQRLCLDEALATEPLHDWGVRGGTSEKERVKMRREGAA